jgi:hypothetical protein
MIKKVLQLDLIENTVLEASINEASNSKEKLILEFILQAKSEGISILPTKEITSNLDIPRSTCLKWIQHLEPVLYAKSKMRQPFKHYYSSQLTQSYKSSSQLNDSSSQPKSPKVSLLVENKVSSQPINYNAPTPARNYIYINNINLYKQLPSKSLPKGNDLSGSRSFLATNETWTLSSPSFSFKGETHEVVAYGEGISKTLATPPKFEEGWSAVIESQQKREVKKQAKQKTTEELGRHLVAQTVSKGCSLFANKFKLSTGRNYGAMTGKDRGLMKHCMDFYGEELEKAIIWLMDNYTTMVDGYPTIGILWGFRMSIVKFGKGNTSKAELHKKRDGEHIEQNVEKQTKS